MEVDHIDTIMPYVRGGMAGSGEEGDGTEYLFTRMEGGGTR